MTKPLLIISAFMMLMGSTSHVQAADAPKAKEEAFSCPALRKPESYKKGDFKNLQYLLVGKDNWFFRSEQDLRTDFDFRRGNDAEIRKLAKYFKTKGIDLVIALPPMRGVGAHQFVPTTDPLAKRYDAAMARNNYKKMIKELNDNGVYAVGNPDIKMGPHYFFKADQHWTPMGAAEMAQNVADFIKTIPAYADIPKMEFKTTDLKEDNYDGTFYPALQAICGKVPQNEIVTLTQTAPVAAGGDALLGDAAQPDIAIVGTSNSANNANFVGRIKEFLSADIYNAAIIGGGIDDSILTYLGSETYKNHPPKILIWEVPSYYDLDGDVVKSMMHQFQPSVFRECAAPLVEVKGVKLGSKDADLLKGKGKDITSTKPYYFGMKLNKAIEKKFTLTFTTDKGEAEKLEVNLGRGYPDDLGFYYAPKIPSGAHLASVTLNGGAGATADVSVCEFPEMAK